MTEVPFIMAIFWNKILWIENEPPPLSELFRKFIRFGMGIHPLVDAVDEFNRKVKEECCFLWPGSPQFFHFRPLSSSFICFVHFINNKKFDLIFIIFNIKRRDECHKLLGQVPRPTWEVTFMLDMKPTYCWLF